MLYDDIANCEKCRVLLEVHSEIEQEGSIVRFVKTVVADVGKADVVGEVGIEHIVADAGNNAYVEARLPVTARSIAIMINAILFILM